MGKFDGCGVSREERRDTEHRVREGRFKPGDIIFIPSLVVIDNTHGGLYGRAHELYKHYYLVVDTSHKTLEDKGMKAHSDVQVVLLDGVHNHCLAYHQALERLGQELPPVIPAGTGMPLNTQVSTDRLIYLSRELLLARKAKGITRLPDERLFQEIQRKAFREGVHKSNTLNLNFEREPEL